jgi:hypothetical protein
MKLSVLPPHGDKNIMLIVETDKSEPERRSVQSAFGVLEKAFPRTMVFLQIQDHSNGYYGFEIWSDKVTREDLEKLFPELEAAFLKVKSWWALPEKA